MLREQEIFVRMGRHRKYGTLRSNTDFAASPTEGVVQPLLRFGD